MSLFTIRWIHTGFIITRKDNARNKTAPNTARFANLFAIVFSPLVRLEFTTIAFCRVFTSPRPISPITEGLYLNCKHVVCDYYQLLSSSAAHSTMHLTGEISTIIDGCERTHTDYHFNLWKLRVYPSVNWGYDSRHPCSPIRNSDTDTTNK